jgi:uncharacterized protein
MQKVIENAITFVKNFFENECSGHDHFHTMRVYKTAVEIAKKEGGSVPITALIALLHDVDDIKISPNTCANKDNARAFLTSNGVNEETIDLICKGINEISYKGNQSTAATTIEAQIAQDADRLDAIGAIGIARAFAYGGNHNRVMHNPDEKPRLNMSESEYRNHVSTTVNHFYEKLFNLKALMNTQTAKQIALEREQYMKDFIARFLAEWDGVK